jgi:hypothetical protein
MTGRYFRTCHIAADFSTKSLEQTAKNLMDILMAYAIKFSVDD